MAVAVTGGNQPQSVSQPHKGLPQGMRLESKATEDKRERERPSQLDRRQMAALMEQLHHLLGDESTKVSALSLTLVLH